MLDCVKGSTTFNEHSEYTKILLNKRVDVNVQDRDKKTCLMYASEQGNLEIVMMLI